MSKSDSQLNLNDGGSCGGCNDFPLASSYVTSTSLPNMHIELGSCPGSAQASPRRSPAGGRSPRNNSFRISPHNSPTKKFSPTHSPSHSNHARPLAHVSQLTQLVDGVSLGEEIRFGEGPGDNNNQRISIANLAEALGLGQPDLNETDYPEADFPHPEPDPEAQEEDSNVEVPIEGVDYGVKPDVPARRRRRNPNSEMSQDSELGSVWACQPRPPLEPEPENRAVLNIR